MLGGSVNRAEVGRREMPAGVVTFVLTDVAGSTRLWEADRDAAARAISRHGAIIDEAVAKHGGARPLEQGEGDSTVSAFARASDAVAAAIDIQRTMSSEPWPEGTDVRVRIGIHTGEAHFRDDGSYAGPALNRCARVRGLGHGGQTLLSRTTADLVRDELPADVSLTDLGEHPLRDLDRPEHVYQLNHAHLESSFPPLTSPRSLSASLPVQMTSFIGREREIDEVEHLLEEARMLTLVGSGGCGKTRLALEVASRLRDRYRHGVLWVDLSSLSDPGLVPSTIANALRILEGMMVDPIDTISAYLERRNLLLVLDNCEHLAAICAGFSDRLLRRCADVTILATSREPLGVEGETTWRVPSLTLPGEGEDADDSESVRLFLERARSSRPQLQVTRESVDAIATICRRLDGIPLAIELAAARIRTMSPLRIAAGLDNRFGLLSAGARTAMARQRTLEASVDWSHALLSEPERVLFRRLAIFAGGFTLEAAERVSEGDGIDEFQVMDLLSQLVDRSLVLMEESAGDTRYRLLETVRDYALHKLADSPDAPSIRDRHLSYFVDFIDRAAVGLESGANVDWADRVERDHDNVRAAIEWAIESGQTDAALRFCGAMFSFWFERRHLLEGRRRAEAILALPDGDPALRAHALTSAAGTAFLYDPFTTRTWAEEALTISRELHDTRTIGRASIFLAFADLYNDAVAARGLYEEGVAAAEASDDTVYLSTGLIGLLIAHSVLADPDRARDAAERAVEMGRSSGHFLAQAQTLTWSSMPAVLWGEFDLAYRRLKEAIALARAADDQFFLSTALSLRGLLGVQTGRYEDARRDLEDAISTARPAGLFVILAAADVFTAELCYAEGRLADGAAHAEEAMVIYRASGFSFLMALGLAIQAVIKEAERDDDAARRLAEEGLELARTGGYRREEGRALLTLARLQRHAGALDRAEDLFHEALSVFGRSRFPIEMVMTLEELASIAGAGESYGEAARLIGAAGAARDAIGCPLPPIRLAEHQTLVDTLRAALGETGFATVMKEGGALTLEGAVAYATRARGERKRPSYGWSSLTPTELDVVRLVQEGRTNPQIAERMFISKNTVMTHLAHVFSKLGISNRTELASEATRRGL